MATGPYQHIMAACDMSPGSERALAEAIAQAKLDHARLSIVHVLVPGVPMLPDQEPRLLRGLSDQELIAQVTAYMERRYLVMASGLKAELVLRRGHPAMEIVAQMERDPVDLLVVGSQGLSGLGLVLFGSVAERLVRRAPCTTLVVR